MGRSTLSEERVERRLTTMPAGNIAAFFADNSQSTSPEAASRMRVSRRDFLLFGTAPAVYAKPLLAAGQVPRIGVIGVGSRQGNQSLLAAFHQGLAALGWSTNDLTVVDRWADEEAEQLSSLAAELVSSGIDLLEPDPKGCCVAPDCVIHGNGIYRDGKRQCGRRSTAALIGERGTDIRAICGMQSGDGWSR